ncbi:MAG TPA: hypothetical protein DIC50_03310 [Verrucomicrobia subdivision 3 bacterium]|nr:hypothetical protein [Limisphaerales bacterium]
MGPAWNRPGKLVLGPANDRGGLPWADSKPPPPGRALFPGGAIAVGGRHRANRPNCSGDSRDYQQRGGSSQSQPGLPFIPGRVFDANLKNTLDS